MKNAALALNAVLLVAVGVLFYLHFSSKKEPQRKDSPKVLATGDTGFKIAYFEWDSITNHFDLFKQLQDELNQKDEANGKEKVRLRQMYQNRYNSYAQKELSQAESEAATQDLKKLEMDLGGRIQKLDQDFQELQMRKNNEVKSKIEDYLKEYNATKGFSYIMIYEPQLIFYRDTVYNITNDLIKGLNEKYPPAKKK